MTDLKKLLDEATATRKAYREACGVGVIGDSAAALVAMMNTDGPEFKAMRAATDALNRAAVNAVPELLALREEVERLREALQKIAKGKYGKCPIEGHWPPEKPCTLCGDLGFFDTDPEYNPAKDGHCVEGGARVVARAALGALLKAEAK